MKPRLPKVRRVVDMVEDGVVVVRHTFYGDDAETAKHMEDAHREADASLDSSMKGKPYKGTDIKAVRSKEVQAVPAPKSALTGTSETRARLLEARATLFGEDKDAKGHGSDPKGGRPEERHPAAKHMPATYELKPDDEPEEKPRKFVGLHGDDEEQDPEDRNPAQDEPQAPSSPSQDRDFEKAGWKQGAPGLWFHPDRKGERVTVDVSGKWKHWGADKQLKGEGSGKPPMQEAKDEGGHGSEKRGSRRPPEKTTINGKDAEVTTRKTDDPSVRQVLVGGEHVADYKVQYEHYASGAQGRIADRTAKAGYIRYKKDALVKVGIDPDRAERLSNRSSPVKPGSAAYSVGNQLHDSSYTNWKSKPASESKDPKGHGSEKRGGFSRMSPMNEAKDPKGHGSEKRGGAPMSKEQAVAKWGAMMLKLGARVDGVWDLKDVGMEPHLSYTDDKTGTSLMTPLSKVTPGHVAKRLDEKRRAFAVKEAKDAKGHGSEKRGGGKRAELERKMNAAGMRGIAMRADEFMKVVNPKVLDKPVDKAEGKPGGMKKAVRSVLVKDVVGMQPLVTPHIVKHYVDNPKAKSDDPYGHARQMPEGFQYKGKTYIYDGHHRVAAAVVRGDKSIKVKSAKIGESSAGKLGTSLDGCDIFRGAPAGQVRATLEGGRGSNQYSSKPGGKSKFAPEDHEPADSIRVETPAVRAERIKQMKVDPARADVIKRAIGMRASLVRRAS